MKASKALSKLLQSLRLVLMRSKVFANTAPLVYLSNQENVSSYPCILIKLDSLTPLPRPIPVFDFSFYLDLLAPDTHFATEAAETLLEEVSQAVSELECGEFVTLLALFHVGSSWSSSQDSFSTRVRISYKGSLTFDKAT